MLLFKTLKYYSNCQLLERPVAVVVLKFCLITYIQQICSFLLKFCQADKMSTANCIKADKPLNLKYVKCLKIIFEVCQYLSLLTTLFFHICSVVQLAVHIICVYFKVIINAHSVLMETFQVLNSL